jgi:hypothetical protein
MPPTTRDLMTFRWSALAKIDAKLLHRFATKYNWDDGIDLMVRCIRHPECSLATALLVYWRGAPHYYRQYKTRSEVDKYELPAFDLLSAIERRVKSGAYRLHGITFNPRKYAKNDYPEIKKKRDIPAYMLVTITSKGISPPKPTKKTAGAR